MKEKKEVKGKKEKKSKKTDLIILNEPIEPEQFAEELRAMNIEDSIEYIQPDFILHPDSIDVKVAETDEKTEDETVINTEDSMSDDNLQPEDSDTDALQSESSDNTANNTEQSETENMENSSESGEAIQEEDQLDTDLNSEESNKSPQEEQPEESPSEQASPIIVSVIDTGADVSHDQLKDYLWSNEDHINGWNFVDENGEIYDDEFPLAYAHGTHISGIIAQVANYQGIPLHLINCKVFKNGKAYTSDVIEAIEFSVEKGAKIINMSFGGTQYNQALFEAVRDTDALFICAVGNNRMCLDDTPIYPACFELPNIISVTSTNADGGFSYFSNYSTNKVDIAARGRDVVSAIPNNKSLAYTGTSMSAAYVSGVAMAISANYADWDISQIKTHILDTADRFSNLLDKIENGRCINLQNALSNTFITDVSVISPADDFDVTSYNPTPSEQLELFSQKRAISAVTGGNHTLILMDDGTVWSFGNNQYDALGADVSGNIDCSTPVQVIGLDNVVSIAASYFSSYAIKNDGSLWSWGDNEYGQLGDGTNYGQPIPQPVFVGEVTSVAAGHVHALALGADNIVYLWGDNAYGQLNYSYDYLPFNYYPSAATESFVNPSSVGAGDFTSAVLDDDLRSLRMCGSNYSGELKNGTFTDSWEFTPVNNNEYVYMYALGASHGIIERTCAVDTWGSNSNGQLGINNNFQNISVPQQVNLESNALKIAAGASHSLILLDTGELYGMGKQSNGQLMNGSTANSAEVIELPDIGEVVDIAAGGDLSLAIKSDGTVWVWGSNTQHQITGGNMTKVITPLQVGAESSAPSDVTITKSVEQGKEYKFLITAENESSLPEVFTIQFDPTVFEVVDLCGLISNNQTENGAVNGCDIAILQNTSGNVQFSKNKTITVGKLWSGIINVITLKAKNTQETSLTILMQ